MDQFRAPQHSNMQERSMSMFTTGDERGRHTKDPGQGHTAGVTARLSGPPTQSPITLLGHLTPASPLFTPRES